MKLPELIVHCDWSKSASKRWMAQALLSGSRYTASESQPVGRPGDLLARLRASVGPSATIVVGFDFPIGIPAEYAARAGVRDFKPFLQALGSGQWDQFYEVCRTADEISIYRPFYPFSGSSGGREVDLLEGLGIVAREKMFRLCERPHGTRRSACSLFWTLGANQVGRASISGWQEVLQPAVSGLDENVRIWPFDGALADLISSPCTVFVETYPGEAYGHLGVGFARNEKKSRPEDRESKAPHLASWAGSRDLVMSSRLEEEIRNGFGSRGDGEDRFDAVVGLFGMLEVILGARPEGNHPDPIAGRVEGWIFGQTEYGTRQL